MTKALRVGKVICRKQKKRSLNETDWYKQVWRNELITNAQRIQVYPI